MNATQQKPRVVGLGEVLWDCFDTERRPGGAPANVAFHAAQLGCEGIVCSRVGTDDDGDALVAFLQQQGLPTDWIQRDGQLPTGRVTVQLSEAGHPTYVIHEPVAWDALAFDERTAALMRTADAVCFGTLAQRNAVSRETIHRCLTATAPHCLRVYDVNLRQQWYAREWVEASLRQCDCLKLNHEEVPVVASLLNIPETEHREFCREIARRFAVSVVCITRGEEGCLLMRGEETADIPGTPVTVADTVGAGDAFTAALLFALLHHWPLSQAGEWANAVGGLVASRPGAMPHLREELQRLIAQHRPD